MILSPVVRPFRRGDLDFGNEKVLCAGALHGDGFLGDAADVTDVAVDVDRAGRRDRLVPGDGLATHCVDQRQCHRDAR